MAAAARALSAELCSEVPMAVLTAIKKSGECMAFRQNGHVHKEEIRDFIKSNGLPEPAETTPLKDQKLYQEVRKLKRLNDVAEGRLDDVNAFVAAMDRILPSVKAILYQRLENEFPQAVAGLDVPGARTVGKRLADQIISELSKLSAEFTSDRQFNSIVDDEAGIDSSVGTQS